MAIGSAAGARERSGAVAPLAAHITSPDSSERVPVRRTMLRIGWRG